MYKEKRIVAMIPARGGSKGIPGKNIKPLCGKPLLAYSIEVALQCPYIDYVLVSTDSKEIAQCGVQYGAQVPFLRPAEFAMDNSKTIDVLLHGIHALQERGEEFNYLVLLQPTQPFRTGVQLSEAIEMVIDRNLPSLVSVCPVAEHPILMRTLGENGDLKSILSCGSTVRRQDFPAVFKVNGSIYINRVDETLNKNTSLNDNQYPYFMTREESIDIDTMEDFLAAEQLMKKQSGGL